MAFHFPYLHKNITYILYKYNCPNIVFRKIWQYAPHTTRPEIYNLQENIYKQILLLSSCRNKYCKYKNINTDYIIRRSHFRQRTHLKQLYDVFGSYKSIIEFIIFMENNSTLRHDIFKESPDNRLYPFKMGSYVHFRKNIRLFYLNSKQNNKSVLWA